MTDDDTVELEKSNILLMGPTGSGYFSLSLLWNFSVLSLCIIIMFYFFFCVLFVPSGCCLKTNPISETFIARLVAYVSVLS
uniref:ATP-dependent Clp protease ATP-binding subunit clpX n=1 Tax=Rhizophora mucronata TaxID=61149 RepID=A0A2P2MNR2_RHIMU